MVIRDLNASVLALGALLGLAACGDDDGGKGAVPAAGLDASTTPITGVVDGGTTQVVVVDGSTAASPGIDAGATPSPAPGVPSVPTVPGVPAQYAVATRVFSTDSDAITTYVQVVGSLDQGTTLDTKKATEFGGPAELFSLAAPRWVAVGEGESAQLSSYSIAANQTIKKEQTISLQNQGLKSFFSNKLYQVSATKVYLPDPDNAQLIALDPTNMKVLGVVALPTTKREGFTPVYSYDSVQRSGKLLFAVAWFDWTNDKIVPETGLVTLDTNTDQATIAVDTRCGGITNPIKLPSGDTYFPSSSLAAASFELKRLATEPCVLRIKAGADVFDPAYHVKLRELTGGAVAGEPAPTGAEEIFLRVLDTTKATIKPETASFELTGQSAWTWRRWNPTSNALTNVDALEPSTANAYWYEVEGRVFYAQPAADYSKTQVIELNAAGGPKNALSGPGLISGIGRVQ